MPNAQTPVDVGRVKVDVADERRAALGVEIFEREHHAPFGEPLAQFLGRPGLADRRLDRDPALFVDDDLEAAGELLEVGLGDGSDAHPSSLPNAGFPTMVR
ncbi:MAG TPA: hypothetical protein VHA76_05970 [Solirubrobacterales bacterium]|nr:hypothetical protein [Solirubrobacterales bacterium]